MSSHPTSELPITSPDAAKTVSSRSPTRRKHSFFLEHTVREVGGSHWVPSWLMGILRFLAGVGCMVTGVMLCVNRNSNPQTLLFYAYTTAFIVMGLAFLLLSVCSFLDVFAKKNERFATFVLFLHVQTVFFLFCCTPSMLIEKVLEVSIDWSAIVVPIATYIVDILVLQSRMLPSFLYILPASIIIVLYSFIDIILSFLPSSRLSRIAFTNPILFIAIYLALMFASIIISCLALGLTRIQNCCYPTNFQ